VSVYDDIRTERGRQDTLAAAGRWGGESVATISDDRRLRVLVEEVGEVARALEEDDSQLPVELVQVAAVAVAWLEALGA
jgi:NTP pyrophosphatase (non-canonical NTP hydrolase)